MIKWNGNSWQPLSRLLVLVQSLPSRFISAFQQWIIRYFLMEARRPKLFSSRGLRQGDPLFPYLFIIGSEVLARLINREVSRGNNKGVKVANGALPMSKLFYADDLIFFCNAKMSEARSLMKCLKIYEEWSGQCINFHFEKSGFFFGSKGVHSQFPQQIKDQWGIKKLRKGTKYLGVLLFLSNKSLKQRQLAGREKTYPGQEDLLL